MYSGRVLLSPPRLLLVSGLLGLGGLELFCPSRVWCTLGR